uniref:NADH-ubiquinone oxidoreductase chain 4L n=1 Tax=Trimusculus reticulatus TaxID=981059 RepID=G8HTF6_9EUPU|nr:NADH dehydrogenase subunit 4L [Trimusculus reticulatus]AEQ93941.1 NADH dehydrogenase subunit 4L [Trimusculus reticulatus]
MVFLMMSSVLLMFFGWTFSRHRTHVLNLLISLEAAMLSILVFFYFSSLLYASGSVLFLMLLTFAACEAAFGLSLLVAFLRVHGNDLIDSFSSVKW